MRAMMLPICLLTWPISAAEPVAEVIFREDFGDLAMPGWRATRNPEATYSLTTGPDGGPALTISAETPLSAGFNVSLPVDRIAGRAVLLDVWRKADGVKTGELHYLNAKCMLSWKAKSAARPSYARTYFSDFSGTFDWERHRYVIELPEDLESASVTIGLQDCSGKASWAKLVVSVDPRFPNQAALERFLAAEEREAFANLDPATVRVQPLQGGVVQVRTGQRVVPRAYWTDDLRAAVLAAVPAVEPAELPADGFDRQLAMALGERAAELEAGLSGLSGAAANDRAYEIVSLRARARQLGTGIGAEEPIRLTAAAGSQAPVSPLIFGNNINTQNLSGPYDSERGRFQDEFLARVRPMGITFLRYPGGCNADVFNWRDTIGPLDRRRDIINYHNGTSRGIARFGVDEYLRFCEEEGMTPIITTAFCKDHPAKVDPKDHPNGIRHPYVIDYLRSAPERVQLAADWVEYCNGSADTPLGRLRAENGHPEPYGVKYWEIGNESYGPDPTGSCSAEEYAAAFPAYVEAMKARDPKISIVMNGGGRPGWNDTILRLAGRHADAFQFHIYQTPRIGNYTKLEGQPHQLTAGMRRGEAVAGMIARVGALMDQHLGRRLPIIISEFGMGNARNRELMTSITSPVLVADMWRGMIESPGVLGANKWCLYTGYWFSQIQGPTTDRPDALYYNRPEQVMHTIYARCRSKVRLEVNNEVSEGAKAVVFERAEGYGVVLISREAVDWQRVTLALPGAKVGRATCLLVTAGHPFLGNENDHELIRGYEFTFDYRPGQPLTVPSCSVMGLIVPRQQ